MAKNEFTFLKIFIVLILILLYSLQFLSVSVKFYNELYTEKKQVYLELIPFYYVKPLCNNIILKFQRLE